MAFGCHEDRLIHCRTPGARVLSVHSMDVFPYLLTDYSQTERSRVERVGAAHAKQSCPICLFPEFQLTKRATRSFLNRFFRQEYYYLYDVPRLADGIVKPFKHRKGGLNLSATGRDVDPPSPGKSQQSSPLPSFCIHPLGRYK